jgi:hypothetical protein|tara:strand:+ start:2526 stop:2927 length:402 start_codon:yes stop_codon:yes gene_type:complete
LIEDNFYATIKFKSGEEIFAQITASEEEDRTMLLVSNPITVEEVRMKGRTCGYKFEPWLKTTKEDLFVIDLDNVLTMSESADVEMICYYQDFIRRHNKDSNTKLDRKMGHLGSVNDAKKLLEELFNMNPASKE